ncbi:hypothetical protein TUBRATIS_28980 [Tubulinosema ratisbonensis]|uniref:Uncharacterized protein n=1 Tax=Tubulinosema ratisbonensis TaxID=291195 RepID=A0A437AHZ1_9MICR|nr:hypothetical protein TUBRATIS_28980 [Tubulinosema ratisbonensis]
MDLQNLFNSIKKQYIEKKTPLKKKLSLINQLKSIITLPYNLTKLIELREELCSTSLTNFHSEIISFINMYPLRKIEDVYTLFVVTPCALVNDLKMDTSSHFKFVYFYLLAKFYDLPLPEADNAVKILSLPYLKDLQIETENLSVNEINLYNDLSKQLNLLKLQNDDVFIEVLEEKKDEFIFFEKTLTENDTLTDHFTKFIEKNSEKEIVLSLISLFSRNIAPNKVLIPLLDYLIRFIEKTNVENLSKRKLQNIQPVFLARILFLLKDKKMDSLYRSLKIPKIDYTNLQPFLQSDYLFSFLMYTSLFTKTDLTNFISKLTPNEIKKVLRIVGRFYLIKNGNNLGIRKLVLKTYLENKDEEFILKNLNNKEIFSKINKVYFVNQPDYLKCINYIYNDFKTDDPMFNFLKSVQEKQILEIKELLKKEKSIFIKLILNKKLVLLKMIDKNELIPFSEPIILAFRLDPCSDYLNLLLKILKESEVYKIIHNLKISLTLKIRLLIKFIDSVNCDKYDYIDKLGELVFLEQSTLNEYINCCWRNNFKFTGFNFDDNFEDMANL